MRIPIVPVDMDKDETLFSGVLDFRGGLPFVSGTKVDYRDIVRRASSYSSTVLITDVAGLEKCTINEVLLKKLKNRRSATWFLTYIERTEDVFDAFNTDADMVLFPYCNVDDNELLDIVAVSNSVIPVLFVRNQTVFKTEETAEDAVDNVFDAGFTSVAVFDLDGSLGLEEWIALMSKGRIVPYSVKLHESVFDYIGAKDVFVDFI